MDPAKTNAPGITLLRLPAVAVRCGLKKSHIYALIAAKAFPAPVKVGRVSVWDSRAVERWILAQVEGGSE